MVDLLTDFKSISAEIFSHENITRRKQEYDSFAVESGNQREYVIDKLKILFPKSWHTMRVSDVGVMKRIGDKRAQAYKEAPKRIFPYNQEKYEEIYAKGMFNESFVELDKDLNRQNYLLLWVNRSQDQDIFIHSIKGFQCHVRVNPITSEPIYVALVYEKRRPEDDAHVGDVAIWTDNQHAFYSVRKIRDDLTVELKPIEGNESNVNDLGKIPFVFYSKRSGELLPFMNNLYIQSVDCNVILSDLHTAAALQGYGQLVFKKPDGLIVENTHTGMTTALEIPLVDGATVQADAYYINANPDLAGLERVAYRYMQSVLSDNGITTNVMSDNGKDFNSGFERLLAEADVQGIIQNNQNIYGKVEQDTFELVNLYNNIESKEKIIVIYPKPRVMISDKETLENIQKRIDLGLITKKDALLLLDPNISGKQAEEKIKEIELEKINSMREYFENNEENSDTAK